VSQHDTQFSFGKNWLDFLEHSLSPERIEIAKAKTQELLGLDCLDRLTFLDIGCGSGIFSYVARAMGAAHVTSFDLDPLSVQCCQYMKERAGQPENWDILQGSILDPVFVGRLPQADIVYSWGVLHHTGDMWKAIRNAAGLVKPGGRLAIAIYNKFEYSTLRQWRGSYKWLKIKRFYNRSGPLGKRLLEGILAAKDIAAFLVRLKNPAKEIRVYKEKRGMSWWFDIVDWLGGYPYEFATAGELFEFCHRELGLQLERLKSATFIGCHELLFIRPLPGESMTSPNRSSS